MIFTVLTLFPAMINDMTAHSVIGRAVLSGLVTINSLDIRDFTENKHRQADDYPYGGGCGMVMMAPPVYGAYLSAVNIMKEQGINPRVLYMTPHGKSFSQAKSKELSKEDGIIILCGHYEGIDQRVIDLIKPEEISLGDFILTGGELAAMTVIDSVTRLLPGVLGNDGSALDESFSDGFLEYPQYTRPAEFMGLSVPEVLLSGHHEKVALWRKEKSLEITRLKRPDLLE